MSTVVKDINESSEKIDEVKRIVKDRALALEYKKQIPQKPIAFNADGVPTHKCSCGEIVGQADYFCPFCGHA